MAFKPDIAIHPGYTLAKILARTGMSQKNLSERTGLSEKHLSQIINGKASITADTAFLLEDTLEGTASFWINLEKNYQETKARVERSELIKKEISLLPSFPYAELALRHFVEPAKTPERKVEYLWKFFGVSSLSFVQNTEAVSFRKKDGNKVKSEAIATWLRCGELEAQKTETTDYSEIKLKESLVELKNLSNRNAEYYSKEVKNILNKAGVILVYIPHFKGTGVSGAVRWIGKTPLIQLSLLGSYADIFWFNLFHEIGHLLLHGKKDKFIEFDDKNLLPEIEKENEADKFATNLLIPEKQYKELIKQDNLTKQIIIQFAMSLGIDPGIVAGRLGHDKLLNWKDVSSLRTRLKFSE
jgi:HTH-type transcriptional regulator/antitoxin HigA